MKCYLHVGTQKTGTSTIQKYLELNQKQLLSNGLIFTTSAGRKNNRKLATACFAGGQRDDATKRDGIKTADDLLKFRTVVIQDLTNEISIAKDNGGKSVIFSSEHFHSRLTKIDDILRLKETLLLLGASEFQVIIYLRNPADFVSSLFSTQIKGGSTLEQPPKPTNINYRNQCDHQATLQRFSAVFGKENITPRIFQKEDLKNGNVLDDFNEIISISHCAPGFIIPKNENESLSTTALEILKRLNKIVPPFVNDKANPVRKNLAAIIARHFTGEKYAISPALYKEYEEAFRDSNEWVRRNYFPLKSTLFQSKTPCESATLIKPSDLDQIANAIGEIWLNKAQ